MTLFSGISAFPMTPVDEAGQLLVPVFIRHLDRLTRAGVDSICLLGSTGAYPYLSDSVRQQVLEVGLEHLAGRVPVIVGVGALRTDAAMALARHASDQGADGLLLAPLSYQKLTEAEVFRHFEAVAGAGNLPLCIYNNPSTTNFNFTMGLLAGLSKLCHVASVKMPLPADGDFRAELAALRADCREGFSIGYSGDWGCADALLAGADCWFSAIASVLPEACVMLTKAAISGDEAATREVDAAFAPLWQIMRSFGSFRVAFAVANHLDGDGLQPPLPVRQLSDEVVMQVGYAVDELKRRLGPG